MIVHVFTRRTFSRRLCSFLCSGAAWLWLALAPVAGAAPIKIDLPAQRLPEALMAVARQADVQVLFSHSEFKDVQAPALAGTFEPVEALNRLLQGTGYVAVQQGEKQLVVRKAADAQARSGEEGMFQPEPLRPDTDDTAADAAANFSDVVQMSQFVVVGIRASKIEELEIKKASPNIVDAIVAEDIGKLPDVNVAEALTRVPGVSLQRSVGEGKNIAVRGLGDGFNVTLLNGRKLASEDPDRRFNYDVLASELVSRIVVNKSSLAYLPEGGIGSVIDIGTYRPFQLADGAGVLSAFSVRDESSGKTNPRLAALYSKRLFDDKLGLLLTLNYSKRDLNQDLARVTEYDTNYAFDPADPGTAGLSPTSAYVMPRAFTLQRTMQSTERYGGTLAVQFRPSEKIEVNLDSLYSKFSDLNKQYAFSNILDQANRFYWEHPQATAVTADAARNLVAMTWGQSGSSQYPYIQSETYEFPRLTETMLVGGNVVYKATDDLKLVVDASTSRARRTDNNNSWDLKAVTGLTTASYNWSSGELPVLTYSGLGSYPYLPAWLENTGNTVKNTIDEFKVDGEWKRPDDQSTLRFGLGWSDETKRNDHYSSPASNQFYGPFVDSQWFPVGSYNNNGVSFEIAALGPLTGIRVPASFFSVPITDYLSPVGGSNVPRSWDALDANSYLTWLQALAEANVQGWSTGGSSWNLLKATWVPVKSYDVTESITHGYVDWEKTGQWGRLPYRWEAGLRLAHTKQASNGYNAPLAAFYGNGTWALYGVAWGTATPYAVKRDYNDVLPSLNLTLYPRKDLLARFAAAKVLTRAPITYLRPGIESLNLGAGTATVGNPDLDPFRATQFDATLEWYYNKNSALLFGAFYKDIDTFIATGVRSDTITLTAPLLITPGNWTWDNLPSYTKTFNLNGPFNSQGASVRGLEFSWTQTLGDLTPALDGFGLAFNATLADSQTHLRDGAGNALPIQNLSKLSYNLIGYYEVKSFGVRLAYNWRDEYLMVSGNKPIYHAPIGWLDASAYYALSKNVTLNVYASNLLDSADKATYGNSGGAFNGYMNYLAHTGVQLGAGVRVKF